MFPRLSELFLLSLPTQTKTHYIIRADFPGMKKEDIQVLFKDGLLTISGERKSYKDDKGEGYHTVERTRGMVSRNIAVCAKA